MNNPDVITLCSSSSLHYIANFIKAEQATLLLQKWIDEMLWEQSNITLFGKQVKIPRLNTWYGDKPYAYSGTRFEAQPMPAELAMLKEKVEKASGLEFNSVLANWYRNGEDCMGWHSDCLLYTSPSPRDATLSRMPSSA